MSGSEDEREDFGAADEHSLLPGKLSFFFFLNYWRLFQQRRSIFESLERAKASVSISQP